VTEIWERQRRSFERTAEDYDRYRHRYPDELFDDIRSYAALSAGDTIVDIGCGTGRATLPMARWGNPLVGVEPAPAMAEVARRKLAHFPNARILTDSFEDFAETGFALAACAQAWHWLDREARVARLAAVLRPGGAAAIFANVQVTPPEDRPFFERVQEVYLRHAPEIAHQGDFREPDDLPSHRLAGSEEFVDLEQRGHRWHWTLNASDYVGLMSTHSNHAALPDDARARLHVGIAELIDSDFEGRVTEHHVALVDLARRARVS
jgi:SAM-dependent methyltransferase